MGGQLENLEVKLLQRTRVPNFDISSRLGISSSFGFANSSSLTTNVNRFDARNARCSTDEDTRRLHNVIGVAGHKGITKLVSEVFASKIGQ